MKTRHFIESLLKPSTSLMSVWSSSHNVLLLSLLIIPSDSSSFVSITVRVFHFCLFCVCYFLFFLHTSYFGGCLSFSPLGPPCLFLSFVSYIFCSSFCYFKLLVQFSSRVVVGLKAAQRPWAPLLAHQAVDVGSSHRPHSPHGPGWHTGLRIPPQCTLCPARPLWDPADWAAACQTITPFVTVVPIISLALSLGSAQNPFWARATVRPWAALMAASRTSWMSSRMWHHCPQVPVQNAHRGPHCHARWEPYFQLLV